MPFSPFLMCYTYSMKTLLTFILVFLLGSAAVLAAELEDTFGQDLLKVPATVRLKFNNQTGRSWFDASLRERSAFLDEWVAANEAVTAQEQKDLKAQKQKDKDAQLIAKDKRAKDRAEAVRVKDKERKAREEARQKDQIRKDLIKKRTEALKHLKQMQKTRNGSR